MKRTFVRTLLAGTAVAGLAMGVASAAFATGVTFDPAATNPGNGSGGSYALSSNPTYSVSGGLGTAYTDLFTGSNTNGTGAYGFDAAVLLTSISGGNNFGLGTSYQIFALISVTGTGTWSSTSENGVTPGFVSGATPTVNVQIYAVKGTGDSFSPATANDASTLPQSNITPGQSVSHTILTGTNFPDFDGATSNMSHNGNRACWDGTAIGGSSNCILLADGTDSTFSIKAGGQTATGDTEEFILSTILSPESYASGANGFFGSDGDVALTINSGNTPTEAFESVDDNTCTSSPIVCQLEGSPGVSWDVNEPVLVPEPTSLSLLGAGLIGFGWVMRRKRKAS